MAPQVVWVALSLASTAPVHSRTEVVEYVHALSPSITDARALRLGSLLYRAAADSGIDPLVLTAIVRQESAFLPDQKVCYIVHRNHACYATCDYGLGQLNSVWVDKWGLDSSRLVSDEAYNLKIATRVLNIIRRQFEDAEPDTWFGRYNTSGPKRAQYQASVSNFLAMAEAYEGR